MSIIHVWPQRRPARKISMSLLCLYGLLMFALSAIMSPHELPFPRIHCGFSAVLRAVLVRAGARGRAEPLVACRQLYPGGDLQPAVCAGTPALFRLHLSCRAQHPVLPQQKAAENRHRDCHRSPLPDEIPGFFPPAQPKPPGHAGHRLAIACGGNPAADWHLLLHLPLHYVSRRRLPRANRRRKTGAPLPFSRFLPDAHCRAHLPRGGDDAAICRDRTACCGR